MLEHAVCVCVCVFRSWYIVSRLAEHWTGMAAKRFACLVERFVRERSD